MADKSPSRSPQHKKHRLSKTTYDAAKLLALTNKMSLVDDTFGSGMSDCDSSVDEIDDSFDANDNTIIHDCDDDDLDDSYDGSDDSYVNKNDRKALDLIMRNLKRTILENSLHGDAKRYISDTEAAIPDIFDFALWSWRSCEGPPACRSMTIDLWKVLTLR